MHVVALAALVSAAAPGCAQPGEGRRQAATEDAAPPGATSCSGCHGAHVATVIPPLEGRSPDEIATAMQAFRNGERPATVMDRIAKGFTDEEIHAIAAWVGRPH